MIPSADVVTVKNSHSKNCDNHGDEAEHELPEFKKRLALAKMFKTQNSQRPSP